MLSLNELSLPSNNNCCEQINNCCQKGKEIKLHPMVLYGFIGFLLGSSVPSIIFSFLSIIWYVKLSFILACAMIGLGLGCIYGYYLAEIQIEKKHEIATLHKEIEQLLLEQKNASEEVHILQKNIGELQKFIQNSNFPNNLELEKNINDSLLVIDKSLVSTREKLQNRYESIVDLAPLKPEKENQYEQL